MRAWLVLCLLHWLCPAHAKRVDPSMVDPLMRRSALDKNFMRFGRSSPPYPSGDAEDDGRGTEVSKEENFLRSMRGKDEISRDTRSRDSYMRFGRGKQDNFMRFGRGKQDNFMRFGRGKQDDFMRFGRGKQDNFMRFGRGKQDNFMRFGRGKQDNFMRFGRGKQDSYMRFGRGKQDNFMRFGRTPKEDVDLFAYLKDSDLERVTRGKQDNFMRFGKRPSGDSDKNIPLAMRSASSFIRYGRARPDTFIRFGKSSDFPNVQTSDFDSIPTSNGFARERKSKDSNLLRYGRKPPSNDDSFIRFGRNSNEREEDAPALIPPRLKRSLMDGIYPPNIQDDVNDHDPITLTSLPDDFEEEYSASLNQEEYSNRRKRSPSHDSSTPAPYSEEDASIDYIATKLRLDCSTVPALQSSLFSAGIPNVIVGPEFSLLPNLNPPPYMKKGKSGDKSFLRLG